MPSPLLTALIEALDALADPASVEDVRRFYRGSDPATKIKGIPIGKIFPVAKAHAGLTLAEIEQLLDDPHYELRMAAVAVMDFQARDRKRDDAHRQALFDLYLRRHDRIDNWGLVDRAAPHVIGERLVDGDRSLLDRLAASANPNERRTALVATHAFIKRGETADTFRIADLLAGDDDVYVQKAIASWTREAGKADPDALIAFLTRHRARLARATLTDASTNLPPDARAPLLAKR